MTTNITISQSMYVDQMTDSPTNINLIEEFMNISDEETKIISILKDEFNEMKFFNYGALVYLQTDEEINSFPHISELLENYEKIFSTVCFFGYFVLRLTKYYVIYNDGLVILSDDGMGNLLNIFKIKNLVLMYNIRKEENKMGDLNFRILKILKKLSLI